LEQTGASPVSWVTDAPHDDSGSADFIK